MDKKIFLFALLFFCEQWAMAQLDREHWFAPMYDRTNTLSSRQYLYFSTNRVTPFPVEIYHQNTLIGTVHLSKGNPQKFAIPRELIITRDVQKLFTPVPMGIHVRGEYAFFANLRFSTFNHAELITSKGTSALGTLFYAGMAPITAENSILNFMCSIMATEDNTQVTVSGYRSSVMFSNGNSGATTPTMSFTLNKGQSYIIEGKGDFSGNGDGFIGSKIVANKPISVTNGNFNGQYASSTNTSSDILMDQSVPAHQLGQNFALVKGNGRIGYEMEKALIIATQPNTEIFVNDETTPIATLQEGGYFLVPEQKYRNQGNGHHNLFIRATQNVYVYQLLSGSDSGGSTATGGFNFIPALNCYLPKQIDELGLIDENEVFSNANPAGVLNIPTRLNIVTEAGATVRVNGNAPPANSGPYPLVGNPNWVTYGIPNVSGNLTITSTKAITAGINAGSDAVGYGGYFAGFNTFPRIIATGSCIPNITLQVDPNHYDQYQWKRNGVDIPGATQSSYTPTMPGNYTVSVTMGSCTSMETPVFVVQKCPVNSTQNIGVCTTTTIMPELSSPSTPQGVNINSVQIVTPPTRGTAVVDPATGQITYTTNNNTGTDTFSYTFCGDNPNFPECETVTVTVTFSQLTTQNQTLSVCEVAGQAVYNLTQAPVTASANVTIAYYPTLADAQNENIAAQITTPNAYVAQPNTTAYAVVKNRLGCKNIAEISLRAYPSVQVLDYAGQHCDVNFSGHIAINLQTITNQIVANPAYFQVRYYASMADANAGNNNTLQTLNITATTTIYIRVDSPDGCPFVIKPILLTVPPKLPIITSSSVQSICDDDEDGIKTVNLSQFIPTLTLESGVSATFHLTMEDARNNLRPQANPATINGSQVYFVRLSKAGFCPNVAMLTVGIRTPRLSTTLKDMLICPNGTVELDAGDGFTSYLWSTGATTQSITVGAGTYSVTITTGNCSITQTVTVTEAPLPAITSIEIKDGVATIHVQGGAAPYQYSLDGTNWQDSPTFSNLTRGNYIVFVRDMMRCQVIEQRFSIINLINAITPNADGFNDTIDYSDLMNKANPVFKIFDRYGAIVFEGNAKNRFIWDGKLSPNHHVPTASYWYILEWNEPNSNTRTQYSSWLLVKNVLGDMLDRKQ